MTTDLYIEILNILEGDVDKATKIKKLIDETIVEENMKLVVDIVKGLKGEGNG